LQKMGRILGNIFFIKQGWRVFGDVLKTHRHQNSIYVPKWGVLVFTHLRNFSPTFWGIFCIL
jgi:hypothetical protein